MAHKAYKFRLYPTKAQEAALSGQLETLRRVYNDALQLSRDVYKVSGKGPRRGYLNQVIVLSRNAQLDDLKNGRGGPKWLTQVSAVSVRDVCARVEVAFDNFFRRIKQGKKGRASGFPRFKGYGRLTSIPFENTYPAGCVIRDKEGNALGCESGAGKKRSYRPLTESRKGVRLDVFGVGAIRVIVHRTVTGVLKTACVERDVDGKWYVVFVSQAEAVKPEASALPPVGIDVGLESFLTTSEGEHVANPKYLRGGLKALRRLQRSSSRKVEAAKKRKAKFRECKNLKKAFGKVAKLHVRVRNLRKEHHHQVANRLVRKYGTVCVEKLRVSNMLKNDKLSRAISDAAWGGFLIVLKRKAESAGVRFVEVDARGTSQTCPECGSVAKKKLSQRLHRCPCGLSIHRDHAAARVILSRGTNLNGGGPLPAVGGLTATNPVGMPREQSGGGRGGRRKPPAKAPVATKVKGRVTNRSRKRSQQQSLPGME